MEFMVKFSHLEGVLNVALLMSRIVVILIYTPVMSIKTAFFQEGLNIIVAHKTI